MRNAVSYQIRRAGIEDAEQLARLRFDFRTERLTAVETVLSSSIVAVAGWRRGCSRHPLGIAGRRLWDQT